MLRTHIYFKSFENFIKAFNIEFIKIYFLVIEQGKF